MVLSWTQDRVGPMCLQAEDCALVMRALAGTDSRDLSVAEMPFNWDARLDLRQLQVGYIAAGKPQQFLPNDSKVESRS